MQRELLLLAERLVVAIESMSQDVRNISAYVYDLSFSVSSLVNEKREKECTSHLPSDDYHNFPSDSSAAAREVSAKTEYSEQYEQADGRFVSHVDEMEQEISIGDVASMSSYHSELADALSAHPERIKIEKQCDSEEIGGPCDEPKPSECGRSNVRVSLKEINRRPHPNSSGFSSMSQIAVPSSQSPSVETMGIKAQDNFLKNTCPSEHATESLQTLHCQAPSAVASCFSASAAISPEGAVERDLLEAGVSEGEYTNSSEDAISAFLEVTGRDRLAHESSILGSRGTERDVRKRVLECSIYKKPFESECKSGNLITEQRPFMCTQCGKSFKDKYYLSMHLRIHKMSSSFKCLWCQRSFSQKSDLTKHMRIHTGEKPFSCKLCGKSFARKDALTDHMRSHSEARPFGCTKCGKCYKYSRQLSEHRRHCFAAAVSAS